MSPVGQTAAAGWQAGIRRTFPVAAETVWNLLLSAEGQELWLGAPVTLEPGAPYTLPDGTTGEVRVVSDRHLRVTWAPPGWAGESTIQLRVLQAASGGTVAFHHDRLANSQERERALAHWLDVLEALSRRLNP